MMRHLTTFLPIYTVWYGAARKLSVSGSFSVELNHVCMYA